MKRMKSKIITIRVDEDLLSSFNELAEELSVNRSKYIINMIKKFVLENKKN
jgi:metal-responsive CopG/Arc/MetJ family transcriptional regulator